MATVRFPLIIVGAAMITAAGCAQQPVKTAPTEPMVASATASTASAPAQAAPNGVSPQLLQMARDAGYRPVVRYGKTWYCRRQIPVGSLLPTNHCVDATRLRFEVQEAQQQRQQIEQQAPMVGQPGIGN